MNRDNDRNEAQTPAQLPDDWGLLSLSGASSNLTPEQDTSVSTSGTRPSITTDDAHSQESAYVNHQLCIVEPDSAHSQQIPIFTLNMHSVEHYSAVLFDYLTQDRNARKQTSTISSLNPIPLPVSAGTLRIFVSHVDRIPIGLNVGAYEGTQMSLSNFLELSTILWGYRCSIDRWLPAAAQMKTQWPQDRNRNRLVSWVFLGLLYNWSDVFEESSLELLSNCSGFQDALDEAKFIPPQLREILENRRKQYVRETFLFIKNKWAMMYEPTETRQTPLYASICDVLRKNWDVDVRRDLPAEELYRSVGPDNLLRQVEAIASNLHSNHPSTGPTLRRTDSPPQPRRGQSRAEQRELNRLARGYRDPEGANALAKLVSIAAGTLRRKMHLAVEDPNCETLLEQCRRFRENDLKPLSLADFAELRSRQLILGNT